jgi:hypothetical protein
MLVRCTACRYMDDAEVSGSSGTVRKRSTSQKEHYATMYPEPTCSLTFHCKPILVGGQDGLADKVCWL